MAMNQQTRRQFFKTVAATCAGVTVAVVAPSVVQAENKEFFNYYIAQFGKPGSHRSKTILIYDNNWEKFPKIVRGRVKMLLGKSTSIYAIRVRRSEPLDRWVFHCNRKNEYGPWGFVISHSEFKRNTLWQQRLLIDTRVDWMLKNWRETTGEKYW